jgi:hypothetical protein
MKIVGIKVGSRSALTAKRDGTVIWTPPIDVTPHDFPWSPTAPNHRVMLAADNTSVLLRSSTTIAPGTLLRDHQLTRQRGTVKEGPIYNAEPGNLRWWYRVFWDDETMPNIGGDQGCWVEATELVTAVENRAPVASTQAVSATVGTPINITLAATDADGDTLSFQVTSQPARGVLSGTAPDLTYTPATPGSDLFSFRASDGVLLSEPGLVSIEVSPEDTGGGGEDGPPTPLSRVGWTVSASSSETGLPASAAIDGSTSSYWRSQFSPTPLPPPHDLRIDLGATRDIVGFRYLPRQSGTSGHITQYECHLSANGTDWGSPVASGTWEAGTTEREVLFTKTPARHIRLRALAGVGDAASVAELRVLVPQTEQPPTPPPPGGGGDTPPTAEVTSLSSITRHGITWTFDKSYPCGQYCNGDWFVVGPVRITAITPTPTEGRNGTVVNPQLGTTQGFDNRPWTNPYSAALNVGTNLPLTVANDSSVVSSISRSTWAGRCIVDVYAILTVVTAPPPSGSFRPPYIGAGSRESRFTENQINYSRLRDLLPPSNTPSLGVSTDYFKKVWYEQDLNYSGGYLHTTYMSPDGYGKGMAIRTGDAALLLNLNFSPAEKRDLLVGFIQYGIDINGTILKGGRWYADGGHNLGRLAPAMVAAAVLNDDSLKAEIAGSSMRFQEFQQTFFVTQSDVDLTNRVAVNGFPVSNYTSANIGMPEWGIRHRNNPEMDNNRWDSPYRDINGGQHTAPAMAARVMGIRGLLNWEALFLYQERHLNYEQGSTYAGEFNYNPTISFHRQFYNAYRHQF